MPLLLQNTNVGRAILLSIIMILLLLFSRACFCFPILCAHNYFSPERVTVREMIIAWCALLLMLLLLLGAWLSAWLSACLSDLVLY